MRKRVLVMVISCIISVNLLLVPKASVFGPKVAQAQEWGESYAAGLVIGLVLGWYLNDWVEQFGEEKPTLTGPPEEGRAGAITRLTEGEATLNKTFVLWNAWRVTLASAQLLEERRMRFNFLIENLQDEPADFYFVAGRTGGSNTYLVDNQANKYYNPIISPEGWVKIPKNMPVEAYMIFPPLNEGTRIIGFYFGFGGYSKRDREMRSENLYYGPIAIE